MFGGLTKTKSLKQPDFKTFNPLMPMSTQSTKPNQPDGTAVTAIFLVVVIHTLAWVGSLLPQLFALELVCLLAVCVAAGFAKAELPSIEADSMGTFQPLPEAKKQQGNQAPAELGQQVQTAGECTLSRPLSKTSTLTINEN